MRSRGVRESAGAGWHSACFSRASWREVGTGLVTLGFALAAIACSEGANEGWPPGSATPEGGAPESDAQGPNGGPGDVADDVFGPDAAAPEDTGGGPVDVDVAPGPDGVDPETEGGADGAPAPDTGPGPGGRLVLGVAPGCNPLGHTEECVFPYPSRFTQLADATRPSGWSQAVPAEAMTMPPNAPPFDWTDFNEADGHSPSAPLVIHLGVDVHADHLVDLNHTEESLRDDAPIALFDLETGARLPLLTEMDQTFREPAFQGRHALLVRPMTPMRMGARHVAVLTSQLTDADGLPVEPSVGFRALRDGIATDHEALETARGDYEALFEFLGERGYAREDVVLAFDFQVASRDWVLGGILSMREQALEATGGAGLSYTIDAVEVNPNPNVLYLAQGTFEVPRFVGARDNRLTRLADGTVSWDGATDSYPFALIVPKRAELGEPMPLVLFGHGIFGTGPGYLAGTIGQNYIQPLAQNVGGVVVATNFIGLSGADQELVATAIVQNLNNIHVITDRLQQSLVNNMVLEELARAQLQFDEQLSVPGRRAPLLSGETYYYGVSLGGVQGISLISLSGRISRAVAAVPGGAWSTMLPRSIVYAPFKVLVDGFYPDPLMHQLFFSLMQSKFDGSDGINLGKLLVEDPPEWALPERRVILLEAIGDCQVPNIVTRMVSRSVGLGQLVPAVEFAWGLDPVAAPTTESVLTQILMPERLELYTPPIDNTIPLMDNETHSDAIVLPAAFEQLEHFFLTGEIEHFCEGPCDPD